jgi:MFS transporter, PPP family, 3-phenylpropionic acid transporter
MSGQTVHSDRAWDEPWFAWQMAQYFAALFLIYGVHITYFPVWLHSRGLSPEQIGVIVALPIFMRTLLTPIIAAHADTRGNHRDMIIWLSCASAVLAVVMSQCRTFWTLLPVAVPFAIAIASIMPLTETIAVSGVNRGGHDYGRMRAWGSATFLLATVICGLLFDMYGAGIGIFGLIAASVATAVSALALPRPLSAASGTADAEAAMPETGLVLALLEQRVFLMFLLCVGAIMGSHAAFYTFGALHLKGQGISGIAFSSLWAISIAAEIAVLAYAKPLVERIGPVRLIAAGGIAAVLRWGAMSLDPPFALLVGFQALHALSYGAVHLGAILFIARATPGRGAGTAQALYSAIGSGLVTGAATLAAGGLYPILAGKTFLVMAALAAAGIAAAIWIDKTWHKGALLDKP